MRRSILACGLLLVFAGMATAVAAAAGSGGTDGLPTTSSSPSTIVATAAARTADRRAEARAATRWRRHIRSFRAGARRWLTVMHGRPPARDSRVLTSSSPKRLQQLARTWQRREHQAWWRANHPPRLRGWLCIHHYEGSWTDSGSPYWGGLQMDYSFQARYGGWLLRHKGTADHWSSLEQIWVAVRAWRVRGFSPWPNTARYCGMA